jgi:formylglycine-generating enzyme required for sulfatase activity
MGNPRLSDEASVGDVTVMRIAALSPFFLDATEMTVARLRATRVARLGDPMPYDPKDGSPGPPLHCTYTYLEADDEALPVNCVSWDTARAACLAKGAELPTEAQLQYAAGALSGSLFVWGEDLPSCTDASFFRALVDEPDERCPGGWVAAPGSGAKDRLSLPGGVIVDLAGNLSEYTLDLWNLQSDACWGTGVAHDPVCRRASPSAIVQGTHTVVGGSWVEGTAGLAAASRTASYSFVEEAAKGPAGGLSAVFMTSIGFRCARPGT